jgi:L-threonylcarbamoyladenylate synthase
MIVPENSQSHNQAAKTVAAEGVIAFRTDTFYGLGADPFSRNAIAKIRKLKGREDNKPILLLISDADEVERFIATRPGTFDSIAKCFWPGPLTLIGLARPELPEELTAGTKTIGLRLPNDENVRGQVRACGGALTATSANVSGKQPARTAKEVAGYFAEGIDLIIDGGVVTVTQPSTVVDLSGSQARLIREGAIPREDLKDLF